MKIAYDLYLSSALPAAVTVYNPFTRVIILAFIPSTEYS